jgi:hypothetical protein
MSDLDGQHRNERSGLAPSGVQHSAMGAHHVSQYSDVRVAEHQNEYSDVRVAQHRNGKVRPCQHRNGDVQAAYIEMGARMASTDIERDSAVGARAHDVQAP